MKRLLLILPVILLLTGCSMVVKNKTQTEELCRKTTDYIWTDAEYICTEETLGVQGKCYITDKSGNVFEVIVTRPIGVKLHIEAPLITEG